MKLLLLLRGLRVKLGGPQVIGDGKMNLPGLDPPVVPPQVGDPFQQPALSRSLFQMTLHTGAVIEGKENIIPLMVFHGCPPLRIRPGSPRPGRRYGGIPLTELLFPCR